MNAPQPLSAAESDPQRLAWMVGSPPPADRLVRFETLDHFTFPKSRWAFANIRQLVPSTQVWRGAGPPSSLQVDLQDERCAVIDALPFTPLGTAARMTWRQSLDANYTDAICVLHRGRLVYEAYRGVMAPHRVHMAMSVTKSYTGTMATMLVHAGQLDDTAPVLRYVPELAGSAYETACVRDVMDMRIGVAYSEDYADPAAGIWEHARAGGTFPRPPGYAGARSYFEFLRRLKPDGPHGQDFFYKTVNTDVLGWIICRVTGRRYGELLSEWFWQPLGCEEDALMLVDTDGTEFAGGGLNATARDMARFGEAMRLNAQGLPFNGHIVVPPAVVDDIRTRGSVQAFRANGPATLPGGAYRAMWWITHNEHGAYAARGIHGQALYIDPAAQMVIARFGSHPLAANVHFDPTSLPAFHALAKWLMAHD